MHSVLKYIPYLCITSPDFPLCRHTVVVNLDKHVKRGNDDGCKTTSLMPTRNLLDWARNENRKQAL